MNRADSERLGWRVAQMTAGVWLLFCALAFSNAGTSVRQLLMAVMIGGAWMLVWLIRLAWFFWRWARSARAERKPFSGPRWASEPLALMLCVLLAWLGVFSAARFALSLPALNAYAAAVRAGQVDLHYEWNHPPRRVGCYVISRTELLPDGSVRVITGEDLLLDAAGFAHRPAGTPRRQGEDRYRPIAAGWWYWQESW